MPQIEVWARLPVAVREHLIERMHDRKISIEDLNRLRIWLASKPAVPEGRWYKDFGTFKVCGEGAYPKTFLLPGQVAAGPQLWTALAQIQNSRSLRLKFPNAPTFASENVKRYWFSLRTEASANRRYSTFTPQQSQLYASSAEPYWS